MGKQNGGIDFLFSSDELIAQFPDAGSAVEYDEAAVGKSNFHARGVSPVPGFVPAGCGY
jgi:hypothetical protein